MADTKHCPVFDKAHDWHNWHSFKDGEIQYHGCPGVVWPDETAACEDPSGLPPSEFAQKVNRILENATLTYAERNAIYKDNFRQVGGVMTALFPDGRPGLKTPEGFNRWHIFELLIVKLTRYANGYDEPHADSLVDMIPYIGILGGLDEEMRELQETVESVFPGGVEFEKPTRRHTAWPKYPAEYGTLPCSMCDGRVTKQKDDDGWHHEEPGRDPIVTTDDLMAAGVVTERGTFLPHNAELAMVASDPKHPLCTICGDELKPRKRQKIWKHINPLLDVKERPITSAEVARLDRQAEAEDDLDDLLGVEVADF